MFLLAVFFISIITVKPHTHTHRQWWKFSRCFCYIISFYSIFSYQLSQSSLTHTHRQWWWCSRYFSYMLFLLNFVNSVFQKEYFIFISICWKEIIVCLVDLHITHSNLNMQPSPWKKDSFSRLGVIRVFIPDFSWSVINPTPSTLIVNSIKGIGINL